MEDKGSHRIYLVLLLVFAAVFTFSNLYWLHLDNKIPVLNNLVYLIMSQEYYNNLVEGDLFTFLVNRGNFYPPLPFQITSVFYLFLKPGYFSALVSQAVFPVIMIFSTFFLGAYLWNRNVGFTAAILSVSVPQTAYFAKNIGNDLPMAAFIPLALYFLFKSDKFRDGKSSLLFFASMALGMLMKWTFLIFVALPAAVYIIPAIRENLKDEKSRKEAITFIISMAVLSGLYLTGLLVFYHNESLRSGAGAAEIFYLVIIILMIAIYLLLSFRLKFRSPQLQNMARGTVLFLALTAHFVILHLLPMQDIYRVWYSRMQRVQLQSVHTPYHFFVEFLLCYNFGLILAGLLLAGILCYFIRGEKTLPKTLLAANIGFSLLALYLQPVYESRYFIALNAMAALFMVFWIFRINMKYVKIPIIIALGLLMIYYNFNWALSPKFALVHGNTLGTWMAPPDRSPNNLEDAARYLVSLHREKNPEKGTLFVFEDRCSSEKITPLLMLYYIRKVLSRDEQALLLYKGSDPIFPLKNKPFGCLIIKQEEEPDGKEQDEGFYLKDMNNRGNSPGEPRSLKDRLEGADISEVKAGETYFCLVRDESKKGNLFERENSYIMNNIEMNLMKSVQLIKNTRMDLFSRRKK